MRDPVTDTYGGMKINSDDAILPYFKLNIPQHSDQIMAATLNNNNNNNLVTATREETDEIPKHVEKRARWLNHPALQDGSKPKANYQLSELQRERLRHKVDIPDILKVPHALVDGEERDCNNQGEILGLFPRLSSTKDSLRLSHLAPLDDFEAVLGSGKSMRVGIVLSGGQAAGGHNVIIGLFRYLKHRHPGSTLLGFLNGPKGIIKNISKVLEAEELSEFRNLGGFHLLGSGRDKIETPEDLAAAAETCSSLELDGLVVIGGDDSNTNAAVLAEYFLAHDVRTKVVGVPKTLDGDLKSKDVPISFGFDTACKVYSEIIGNIMVDALSAKKYWHFIRLMGRAASHVTLEAALQTHPQIAFISEEIAAKHVSLGDVARIVADCVEQRASVGKNYGVVLLPEGLVEFVHDISTLIAEINSLLAQGMCPENIPEIEAALTPGSRKAFTSMSIGFQKSFLEERDPHGNVQVAHIECEKLLIRMVENELEERKQKGTYVGKFSGIPHYLGYEGRCSLPTNFDSTYCHALGAAAGALLGAGKTGIMAAISDLHLPTTKWRVGGVPLVTMMNMELRKGKEKSVIKKALVDLDGEPMKAFKALRKDWMLQDCYRSPGPIQFKGHEWADVATITLSLELNDGKPILLKDTENTTQFD